jgi:hypothetical protein
VTRAEIRDTIRENLDDAGVTFYTDVEMNSSIQDCYNEVCAKTLCLAKTASGLSWQNSKNYYDPIVDLAVADYIGTIGVFNNNTKFWLFDNVTMRDFDRIRRDWELWNGQPEFWSTHSLQRFCVVPKMLAATGTFDLRYYAKAPVMTTDSDVPLIATDMHDLFEFYCTGDLLESADEITKAASWWSDYTEHIEVYKQRVHNLAKTDLLLRV